MSQIIIRHLAPCPTPLLQPRERRKVRDECCQNVETYFRDAT
jgi:hypothetical protein